MYENMMNILPLRLQFPFHHGDLHIQRGGVILLARSVVGFGTFESGRPLTTPPATAPLPTLDVNVPGAGAAFEEWGAQDKQRGHCHDSGT